jgi:nitrogen fixation NifU-like protein
MDSLYTELIMMHNKSGHNRHVLEEASHIERGHNPSCGDDLTLQVMLQDGKVVDAAFLGTGCAISQASMSIMIDLIKGKSIDEAKELADNYLNMIRGVSLTEAQIDNLEDAQVFASLSKMPARVKCGTLGWHCLDVILEKSSK